MSMARLQYANLGMVRRTRAHRFLALAYRKGESALRLALLEHLFHARHVEGKDIGNMDLLAFYADNVGLLPTPTAVCWPRTKDLEEDVRRLAKISVQGGGLRMCHSWLLTGNGPLEVVKNGRFIGQFLRGFGEGVDDTARWAIGDEADAGDG